MLTRFINFIARPLLGNTQTDNLVYQQSLYYPARDYRGNGGHLYAQSLSPIYPAGLAVGPTQKIVNPAVTGNINATLETSPLMDSNTRQT